MRKSRGGAKKGGRKDPKTGLQKKTAGPCEAGGFENKQLSKNGLLIASREKYRRSEWNPSSDWS